MPPFRALRGPVPCRTASGWGSAGWSNTRTLRMRTQFTRMARAGSLPARSDDLVRRAPLHTLVGFPCSIPISSADSTNAPSPALASSRAAPPAKVRRTLHNDDCPMAGEWGRILRRHRSPHSGRGTGSVIGRADGGLAARTVTPAPGSPGGVRPGYSPADRIPAARGPSSQTPPPTTASADNGLTKTVDARPCNDIGADVVGGVATWCPAPRTVLPVESHLYGPAGLGASVLLPAGRLPRSTRPESPHRRAGSTKTASPPGGPPMGRSPAG